MIAPHHRPRVQCTPAPFEPPDLIIQVVDATQLQSHLELTLELSQLGRPMVLALNHMDTVRRKGLHINQRALGTLLGIPVVPISALLGQGIAELFNTAVATARQGICQLPQAPNRHIANSLEPLSQALTQPGIDTAFRVPHQLLLLLFASGHAYFERELQEHFAARMPDLQALREAAGQGLPRPWRKKSAPMAITAQPLFMKLPCDPARWSQSVTGAFGWTLFCCTHSGDCWPACGCLPVYCLWCSRSAAGSTARPPSG